MAAGQLVPVPTLAEIESRKDKFSQDKWGEYLTGMTDRSQERAQTMATMTPEERTAYRDQNEWDWMVQDAEAREKIEEEIVEYSRRTSEDLNNRKSRQQELGFLLSRFSPASAYKLAAMNIAATDVNMKQRTEQSMNDYRDDFSNFVKEKQKESGGMGGGVSMSFSTGNGDDGASAGQPTFSISSGHRRRDDQKLDLEGLPEYRAPQASVEASLQPTIIDTGILSLFSIVAFGISFMAFIRYDVR